MSERSLSVYSAIEPFAGGVIGLSVGYSMAPHKYSLKDLLTLDKDTFNKIYSADLIANFPEKRMTAFNVISQARRDYAESKKSLAAEIRDKSRTWREMFNKVDVPHDIQREYSANRMDLKAAIEETNYISLNKKYREVKNLLSLSPEDEGLKAELAKANSKLSEVKAIINGKIEAYRNSVRNLNSERLFRVKEFPAKYANVRVAYHEFLKTLAKRRTLSSNKLFELSNDQFIKRGYEDIKDMLPKARTKSALTGAAVFGSMTAVMTFFASLRQTN